MGMRPRPGDKYGNETKQGDVVVYNDKQHIQQ